jgi:Tfp pilus assembly protein PilF
MKIVGFGFCCWVCLYLTLPTCLSQSSPDLQKQIQSHNQRAAEYLKNSQPDLAASEFKSIIDLDPGNVDARGNLGTILFFQGAYKDAIPQLRTAVKFQPTLWKTEALLGIAEKRTGDADQARLDLEKAFSRITEKKIKIEAGMQLIEIYSHSGELDKAAAVVAVLRKLEPTDANVLYTAYRIYSDLTDDSLLSLSMVAPQSARMNQAMAHELAKRGSTAESINDYREAIKLDPNIPGIHFELAEILRTADTPESRQEAEAEYKAAIQADRLDEQSQCRLGDIALRADDLKAASEYYTKAVQLRPDDPDANIGLAKVMMSLNESQKAEELLKRALELDPTSALAHYRLGILYRQTGRIADAKHELEEYEKYKKMKEELRKLYHNFNGTFINNEDDTPN